jgi:uncharacterized Zn finger protein
MGKREMIPMTWYKDMYPTMSVEELREKARRSLADAERSGRHLNPVTVTSRTICKSWWGRAWCQNMENYLDYTNRLPRGRSYVRNGAVIDLSIREGKAEALVQGSEWRPYKVTILVDSLSEGQMEKISRLCSRELDSMEELIAGHFPKSLESLLTEKGALFPTAREIEFYCTCPDSAHMCKHVAAAMYGIGVRLDENPFYFFILRGIDVERLVKKTLDSRVESMLAHGDVKNDRIIDDREMEDLFHLE